MYDVCQGLVPDIFKGMFVYDNMIHYHGTRISGHIHTPTTSSNFSRNSIRYTRVLIWNKILTALMNSDSCEVSFKIMLIKGIQSEAVTHIHLSSYIAITNYLLLLNPSCSPLHWYNASVTYHAATVRSPYGSVVYGL